MCNVVNPIENGQIELCYPHGCCHLFCESVKGAPGISFSGVGIKTNGQIICISDPNKFYERIKGDVFPPVMCYFDPAKEITSGANFINAQKSRLQSMIYNSKNIALVGIRVRPNDAHIWGPLEKTKASLVYCGGKTGGEEFNNWKSLKRGNSNDIVINDYFEPSFEKLCEYMEI